MDIIIVYYNDSAKFRLIYGSQEGNFGWMKIINWGN